MNLKEIKDAARQAFSDQQMQDTEGGVPDIVSFCAGFLAGVRHANCTPEDEYIVVKDIDNNKIGKRKVHSKINVQGNGCYVINHNLLYSYGAYELMQEEAKILSEIE